MLKPTPGELLSGIHRELKDQVLPTLPAGTAARQLRAALHTIDHLARSWDLQHSYIAADNRDLNETLQRIADTSGTARQRFHREAAHVEGVSDEALAEKLMRNLHLQRELEAFQNTWRESRPRDEAIGSMIVRLHQRMVDRAAIAAGLTDQD